MKDWKEEFYNKHENWLKQQYGSCACLGDCDTCHHHVCFGCFCWAGEFIDSILDQQKEELIKKLEGDDSVIEDGITDGAWISLDRAIEIIRSE